MALMGCLASSRIFSIRFYSGGVVKNTLAGGDRSAGYVFGFLWWEILSEKEPQR